MDKRRHQAPSPPHRSKTPLDKLATLLSRGHHQRQVELTEDHVLSILSALRARDVIFGANLFSDPAWDMLLELYAAKLGGRRMTLQDIARAIDLPKSTAARWLTVLEDRGLTRIEVEEAEPPRQWVALTDEGAAKLKRLADHWGSAFVSI